MFNKLTVRLPDEPIYIPDENKWSVTDEFGAKCLIGEVVNRLAAYEDTGLTPEQIKAQQQEINQLKDQNDTLSDTVNMFAPYIIGKKEAEVVEDLKELLTLKQQNAALIADKDEQAGRLMKMDYLLRRTLPILEVANDQQELIEAIDSLLGGAEDGK